MTAQQTTLLIALLTGIFGPTGVVAIAFTLWKTFQTEKRAAVNEANINGIKDTSNAQAAQFDTMQSQLTHLQGIVGAAHSSTTEE